MYILSIPLSHLYTTQQSFMQYKHHASGCYSLLFRDQLEATTLSVLSTDILRAVDEEPADRDDQPQLCVENLKTVVSCDLIYRCLWIAKHGVVDHAFYVTEKKIHHVSVYLGRLQDQWAPLCR